MQNQIKSLRCPGVYIGHGKLQNQDLIGVKMVKIQNTLESESESIW